MKIIRDERNFGVDETQARRLMDDVLARPLFAHLATSSDEGARDSPVWYLWEDEKIWIIGNHRSDSFPRRVERQPRCAVGIVNFNVETGLVQHVGFRGRGSVRPQDPDRMRRLLQRYLGDNQDLWDPRFFCSHGR